MPNRFMPITAGSTLDDAIRIMNANFALLDGEAVTKTFNGPGGNAAYIQGRLPNDQGTGLFLKDTNGNVRIAEYIDANNNPVLKVSKVGKDAVTGVDADMIFNSSQDVFKIVSTGTGTIPTSGTNSSTLTIAHDLPYIPVVIALGIFFGTNYSMFPVFAVNSSTGTIASIYQSWADATNVYFSVITPGSTVSGTTPIKYYLMQESAS